MNWKATHRDRIAQRGFTQVENVVLFNEKLSIGARVLYAALKHYAWRGDGEIPPQVEVAKALGVSERALKTYAGELRNVGLLTTRRRMSKPSLYIIEPPQIEDPQSGNICPNEGADFAPLIGQDLPEQEKEDKYLKTENPNGFSSVVDHWLTLAPPLVAHKREPLLTDKPTRKLVDKALAEHGLVDVATAIANYALILNSPEHWLDQRWTMYLFFKQRNAFPMFLPEAEPLINYRNREPKNGRDRGLTFDEILTGGMNEPGAQSRAALPAGL